MAAAQLWTSAPAFYGSQGALLLSPAEAWKHKSAANVSFSPGENQRFARRRSRSLQPELVEG